MSCSQWAWRSSARTPPYVFPSANGRLLMKSKRVETLCRKLSNVCTRERAPMPLLKQLEFALQTEAASLWDASRFAQRSDHRAVDLQEKSRELLRAHGADRIARELRVEWNSRLKTAAGRANYREKLIS